ncbi:MAG: hypothetical protein NTW96_01885 [Planctomycetia bacterium]|nr:hypothetical protein [Planctomycetia bacterium]
MTKSELETAALDAHAKGEPWAVFWQRHEADVRRLHPWDRRRFGRLYLRLFSLVTSGDLDGVFAPGDPDAEPQWEVDDTLGQVSDTATQAKLQPGFLFDARPLYE